MGRVYRGRGKLGRTGLWSLLQDTEILHLVQMKPLFKYQRFGEDGNRSFFMTVAKSYGTS